jgi:hypothetical protein
VPPSRALGRPSRLRPSVGTPGRALEEGRLLVPCQWIVEPWTHQPQRPAANSQHRLRQQGRGRGGNLTPPTTSRPARPSASTTENTTPALPADEAAKPGHDPGRGGRGCTRPIAATPVQRLNQPSRRSARSCGISTTASGAPGPAREARHFAQIDAASKRPHRREISRLGLVLSDTAGPLEGELPIAGPLTVPLCDDAGRSTNVSE